MGGESCESSSRREECRERLKKVIKCAKEARQKLRKAANASAEDSRAAEGPAASRAPPTSRLRRLDTVSVKLKAPVCGQRPRPENSKPAAAEPRQSDDGEVDNMKQRAIDALERDVAELSRLSAPTGEQSVEIERIRREVEELKRDFYTHLGAWQRLLLARHPQRPYTDDYIRLLFENFSRNSR